MSSYNEVPYLNLPYAQTHPSRLFVMGRLAGIDPPALEKCRVLELGASEGENLVGMAMVLPSAEFVGVELAEIPVARGQKTILDLGLGNVRLLQMNVLDVDERLGEFDYIIAHGLYSWTPPMVRDKILAIAGERLSANGIAYVSYNTYPYGHLRRILREMMRFRIGNEIDPGRRMELGREAMQWIVSAHAEKEPFDTAVVEWAGELLAHTDSALYHDDLSETYEPVYFHEFVAHAARHGLQYISESRVQDLSPRNITEGGMAKAREMAGGDRIAEEQYLDFVRNRAFRQSLLCRAEVRLGKGNLEGCYASAMAQEAEDGAFVSAKGTRMTTPHPEPIAYMRRLIAQSPCSEQVVADDRDIALELYRAWMITLNGFPGIARRAGERPETSAFARYQAARGDANITTLAHRSMKLSDDGARKLIGLLDGTRDRAELAREMECPPEQIDSALGILEKHEIFMG